MSNFKKPLANFAFSGLGLSLLLAGMVTGCTRTTDPYQGTVLPAQQRPATPLQPSPPPTVNSSQLAPAATSEPIPEPPTSQQPTVVETASLEANAQPVTRQALVGAWTVSTGGSGCQIFLALTKWSGGYRAASRGCTAPDIASVQAWDVKGKQVVLVNSSGGTAATLYRSSAERFDGATSGGSAISFSR